MAAQRHHRRHGLARRLARTQGPELLLDDAPRRRRGFLPRRAPGHRHALEIGEIIEEDAVERVDVRLGVARDRGVDDEDRTLRPAAQGGGDTPPVEHGTAAAERRDDDIGGGEGGVQILERNMIDREAPRRPHCAIGRAAEDEAAEPAARKRSAISSPISDGRAAARHSDRDRHECRG